MAFKTFYRIWILVFFLKAFGAAWDASYHFKYFFEESSLPHVVNTIGFVIGAFLLIMAFRKKMPIDDLSRNIVSAGYVLFLIAIPLDFIYHAAYGIDLTTWSVTHFLYYIATAMMVGGIWRGYTIQRKQLVAEGSIAGGSGLRNFHSFWAAFFLENLLFPCMQQENGAVGLHMYLRGESTASAEILELVNNNDPFSQFFGGIPDWLYVVYSVTVITLFVQIVRLLYRDTRIALIGLALYIAFRYMMYGYLILLDYPLSFIPFVLLIIPLSFYVFRFSKWVAAAVSTVGYFYSLYAIYDSRWMVTPPVEEWMLIPCLICVGVMMIIPWQWMIHRLESPKEIPTTM